MAHKKAEKEGYNDTTRPGLMLKVGALLGDILYRLIFSHDGIEFDELALMVLTIVNQLSELLSYCLDIVETWQ